MEATAGPGIASCTDSSGSASPGAVDTAIPGLHSYIVTALSLDGKSTTARIEYMVASSVGSPGAGGNNPGSGSPGGGAPGTPGSGSQGGVVSGAPGSGWFQSGGVLGTGSQGPSFGPGTVSTGARPVVLSGSGGLARALKACRKLKKGMRAGCIAAAKKRFASKHKRHRRALSNAKRLEAAGSRSWWCVSGGAWRIGP